MASEPKTKITVREAEQPTPESFSQRKQPEQGQFRLQVDRQTKSSYASFEAAETAGLVIKKAYPSLQVAVYNHKESINKIIELPEA
jgi:hypothetical protein